MTLSTKIQISSYTKVLNVKVFNIIIRLMKKKHWENYFK